LYSISLGLKRYSPAFKEQTFPKKLANKLTGIMWIILFGSREVNKKLINIRR
jgi:hypothetical protein